MEDDARDSFEEFLAQPSDVRRGCVAILTFVHMADHWFWARPHRTLRAASQDDFRSEMSGMDPDFRVLRDAANAIKHGKPKDGRPRLHVNRRDEIARDRPGLFNGVPLGQGYFADQISVVVPANGGRELELRGLVVRMLTMRKAASVYPTSLTAGAASLPGRAP